MNFFSFFDLIGTIVFAISGVIIAGKAKMDPFGVIVLGLTTAIGGGTIRDIILNHGPVFWIADPRDAYAAILTCIVTILFIRHPNRLPRWLLPVLDAIGLAVFVAIGVDKAISANVNGLACIFMGVLTGVGGGILRDVLAREIPLIFRTEIYATACIFGGLVHYWLYYYLNWSINDAMIAGMIITLSIRLAAIYWKLKLPTFSID